MERFLNRLQAKGIDRLAVGYTIAGWILVQAAAIILPAFLAPPWVLRALIILVLAGFPVALTSGWFAAPHLQNFELSRVKLKRWHVAVLTIAVVLVMLFVSDLAYQFVATAPPPAAMAPGAPQAPAKASIAVLPFANMSGDPSKEYFSDGISEELLDDLSNAPALRVAARTSSFAFKGKDEDIKTIARILSVLNIVEGSVRESGNHVRVTAELIDARDGFRKWSSVYDRNLTDILQLQDDIAGAITTALTHRLVPIAAAAQRAKPIVIDPDAYRNYLLGQHELGPRTEAGSEKARALFAEVTAKAPAFAEGFAALARADINLAEYQADDATLMAAADAALKRALALDPRNVSALTSHLDLSLHKLDWQAADDDAYRLWSINADSAPVLHEMFRYYQVLGFPDLAFAAARGAASLDPLSFVDRYNVAAALNHTARFHEAVAAARAALALQADDADTLGLLCIATAQSGDLVAAKSVASRFASAHDAAHAQDCAFSIAVAQRRFDDAKTIADGMARGFASGDISAASLGDRYATAGDAKDALLWLNRAYDARDFVLFTVAYDRAIPPSFFQDPGWNALTSRKLFADWAAAHNRLISELAAGRTMQ